MKRLVGLAALIGTLALAGGAQAHYSHGWYWSESAAGNALEDRYDDVIAAECEGLGHPYRRRLYKHFDCYADTDDGDTIEAIVHVTSRNGFKVTFPEQ
jgi:hypothetical protein